MSDTFGGRLRRERERQQITVESITARTKIKGSLFEELERDDVSHWPSGIFRRSFIKAYANAIGVDVDATVREFLERFPDATDPPPIDTPVVTPAVTAVAPAATVVVAEAAPGPPRREAPSPALRLTLVETGLPFAGGRLLADGRRRWSAAVWDLGSIVAMAVTIFVVLGSFWRPFAVTALCYYVGGILLLGNSPGVCLFAPKPAGDSSDGSPKPARVPRLRPTETVQMSPGDAPFRAMRYRTERRVGLPH